MSGFLSSRGPDGRDRQIQEWVALAHQHFWTTPEAVGERQPLRDPLTDVHLVFDGRLDNREDLVAEVGSELTEASEIPSDASLVLAAYRRWGPELCQHLIGPFALVIADLGRRQVLCARDPLGDRSLFYNLTNDRLLVASEEGALLAHPEIGDELDRDRLACFFALRIPADGSTFFRQVRELPPGERLRVRQGSVQRESFWDPSSALRLARRAEADLAEEYRWLLQQAVKCRLRASEPPAVMMSGGLDSTSVVALGAEELARSHPEWRLRTVSWIFDEHPSCDERSFMDPVIERFDLEALRIECDDAIPLSQRRETGLGASTPEDNVYRELKRRAYSTAAQAGSRVVLNCASADALYTGSDRWFGDLVSAGHPISACGELFAEVGRRGLRGALRNAGLLRWPARALHLQGEEGPLWLRPEVRRQVAEAWAPRFETPRTLRPQQLEAVAGMRAARGISLENAFAAREGVEVRDPYRDLRVVEFMLQLPAHFLYRRGRYKPIARRAMQDRLPESILGRTEPTLLTPLFDQGLRREHLGAVKDLLGSEDAVWPQFVERRWVEDSLRGSISPALDVVLWHCVSFQLWLRRRREGSTANSGTLS